jgi:hypothetical protein
VAAGGYWWSLQAGEKFDCRRFRFGVIETEMAFVEATMARDRFQGGRDGRAGFRPKNVNSPEISGFGGRQAAPHRASRIPVDFL